MRAADLPSRKEQAPSGFETGQNGRRWIAAAIGRIIQPKRLSITQPLRELALQTPNGSFFSLLCNLFRGAKASENFILPGLGLFFLKLRDAGFDCFESHKRHRTQASRRQGNGSQERIPSNHTAADARSRLKQCTPAHIISPVQHQLYSLFIRCVAGRCDLAISKDGSLKLRPSVDSKRTFAVSASV